MEHMEGQLRDDEDDAADDVWCPDEAARAAWALSRLKAEPHSAFFAACLRHCFSRARRLGATGACRLLWSLGNARGWAPPRAWVARALAATHARIGGFRFVELALMATSLARLEHRPHADWLATFAAAALAQLEKGGARVRSRAREGARRVLGRGRPPGRPQPTRRRRQPAGRLRPPRSPGSHQRPALKTLPPLLTLPPVCASRPRPPPLPPQALSNLLWALATLGFRPDAPWVAAAHARLVAQADHLTAPTLLQATWALGRFGWRAAPGDALLARGAGVLDTPRASLQRMRWAARAERVGAKAAAAAEAAAAKAAAAAAGGGQARAGPGPRAARHAA
jgi:hypothetical protein